MTRANVHEGRTVHAIGGDIPAGLAGVRVLRSANQLVAGPAAVLGTGGVRR